MKIEELLEDIVVEGRMVWRKMGNTVKRAVRCTSGRRKGRVVANAAQCSKPIDIKKRMTLRRTKARMGKRIAFKARRTKRTNPASRRLRTLNRPVRRR